MNFKRLIILSAAALAASLVLSGCGEKKIDAGSEVYVKFSGLDGSGTAKVDYGDLYETIESVIVGTDNDDEATLARYAAADEIEECIDFSLDRKENLKNGDKVTLTFDINKEKAKKGGVVFTNTDPVSFTVSGLQEVQYIDPFDESKFNVKSGDGVYIEFTDVSPFAKVQIRNTLPSSDMLSKITYSTDDSLSSVKKGQEIIITAEAPIDWEEQGYVLEKTETAVTVDKVDEYITSIDDIDDDTMNKIVAQCSDLAKAKIISKADAPLYSDDSIGLYKVSGNTVNKYENLKFTNAYFISLKDGLPKYNIYDQTIPGVNGLYLTFTVDMKGVKQFSFSDESYDIKNATGFFRVKDIVKDKEGKLQFSTDMVILGQSLYTSEESFKITVINTYLDSFTMTEQSFDKKL